MRFGINVKSERTPWLDSGAAKRYASEKEKPGVYEGITASRLMAGLYSARAARPDRVGPTLRLARQVHRWTAFDDRKLIRYLGYLRGAASEKLRGSLSTEDKDLCVLRVWPDTKHT